MKQRMHMIAGTFAAIAFFALPGAISAAESVSIMTVPVPQQQGAACPQPVIGAVTDYVFDDGLNSFEFTISDFSYVALAGTAGDVTIPFHYITRDLVAGQLRMHVDVPESAQRGTVPVTLVMLSAAGPSICLTTLSFTVEVGGQVPQLYTHVSASSTTRTEASNTASGGETATTTASATSSSTGTVPVTRSFGGFFGSMCAGGQGSFELWFVLLALYIVLVAFAALAEVPYFERYPWLPFVTILVPLILLLAFWYFAVQCRTDAWAPYVLLFIAALGMIIAYRNSRTLQAIQLPPARQ